ncbi:MAG: hypothetical protein EOP05_21355 [Proteobacteria bacterium]|nr:MAG: hypothetical protein EOP05_21355 [Pseudomonadota bacterium]
MYGYGEVWSFGGDIAYSNLDTDPGKSDGLEPIRLFGAGRRQLGSGTIFYGLRAQFAVANAKLDVNGASSESNRTYGDILSNIGEGGFELAPWIGWQMPAGPGVFGARVSYEVVNTDTDVKLRGVVGGVNSTVDVTGSIKGGSEGQAAVFYEFNVGDMPLGAALTYDFYSKIEQDFENAGIIASDIGARSLIGVNLYTRLDFGGFGFIPSLVWREKVSSGDDIDKLSDVRLNLAGRFSF